MSFEDKKHARIVLRLKRIAKKYGLKVRFYSDVYFSGEYVVGYDLARIDLDETARYVISTFFHELGHHLDYYDGKFPTFYNPYSPLYRQRRVALKAEISADNRGQKLCKQYFPKLRYKKFYRSIEELEFLREYYKDGRSRKMKF